MNDELDAFIGDGDAVLACTAKDDRIHVVKVS